MALAATARPIKRLHRRAPLCPSRAAFYTDLAIFVLGVGGAISVNLVGSFPGNELLLLPILPALLFLRGGRAFRRQYLWFWIVVGAWLLGTVIADSYFEAPLVSRLKGTARVVFFALNFATLAILINDKSRRITIFAISLAVVMARIGLGFLGESALVWKFGLSGAVSIPALLVSSHYYIRRRYAICILIAIGLAGLNLYYGFRSQLVIHLLAGVLILPIFNNAKLRSGPATGSQSRFRVIILLALASGAAYVANSAVNYGSLLGLFDESLQSKFESQSKGDYGVLIGGRPETLVAIQAIRDRPILGHGSYPVDRKYIELKQDIQYEHGYSDYDGTEDISDAVIPTHSHLTMAWVESGILGGICWIYIFILTCRAILQLGVQRPPMAPLYCYLLVWFLWNILYSPFGSVNRLWAAFFILLSYHILQPAMGVLPAHRLVLPARRLQVRYVPGRRRVPLPRGAVD
jgi:O-antigen ligase